MKYFTGIRKTTLKTNFQSSRQMYYMAVQHPQLRESQSLQTGGK